MDMSTTDAFSTFGIGEFGEPFGMFYDMDPFNEFSQDVNEFWEGTLHQ